MAHTAIEKTLALAQYLLPQHAISRLIYRSTRWQQPVWKNFLIKSAIKAFEIDLAEARSDALDDYPSFNHFFTRELLPGVRPIATQRGAVVCPADGRVSQLGRIKHGRIFQAKGYDFSLQSLLGATKAVAGQYAGGSFINIYLSPQDYHRVHMPMDGKLIETRYIPGRLFSVSPLTVRHVPRLFARNERLVCRFAGAKGEWTLILVGAMLVSSIETVWQGEITPTYNKQLKISQYGARNQQIVRLDKGAEMGRFNMGSTVILLSTNPKLNWRNDLEAETGVKMGELLGKI